MDRTDTSTPESLVGVAMTVGELLAEMNQLRADVDAVRASGSTIATQQRELGTTLGRLIGIVKKQAETTIANVEARTATPASPAGNRNRSDRA